MAPYRRSLTEPQDCSDDSAAGQCARTMHHLLPSCLRWLPVERPACALGPTESFDVSRPDTANHPGSPSPGPAGHASASRDSASAVRTANRVLNSLTVRFSPLASAALSKAARQLPVPRRTSTAYTRSESTHEPIGAVCPRCSQLVSVEGRRRRHARLLDLRHRRRACSGRDRHRRQMPEVRGKQPRNSPRAQSSHRRDLRRPRCRGAVVRGQPQRPYTGTCSQNATPAT